MIERLLMMRAQAQGCTVEAFINDIPLGRVGHAGGCLCLPVHEYVVEGENEIRLVIEPGPPAMAQVPPTPRWADGSVGATMQLLLPRIGRVGSEDQARTVAEIAWAAPDGAVYDAPLDVSRSVVLPIKFPRWRWLDVPPMEDVEPQRHVVAAFLHKIAADLMRGDVQALLSGSRLRLEELALAYQQPAAELAARLASRLEWLHARKCLKLVIPGEHEMVLRRCAHGRLLECLDSKGAPFMHTSPSPEGISFSSWTTRVAVVNGHCHILR